MTRAPSSNTFFFVDVRTYQVDGDFAIDRANWLRLRLFMEPFRRITLVATPAGAVEEGVAYLPLPPSVSVELGLPYLTGRPLRRSRLAAAVPAIVARYARRTGKAGAVAILASGSPLFYGSVVCARLARRRPMGIIIGSAAKSFRLRAGEGARPRPSDRIKAAVAGAFESYLYECAEPLFVAGQALRDEIGRGVPFDTTLFRRRDVADRVDTCQGPRVRWIYVGAVSIEKGCDTLLRALHQVRSDVRHSLVLVGPVDRRFPVTELLANLDLEERVEVAGARSWDEVRKLLGESDVFVFGSLHEGMPKAPLEAMGQGVPVVCTATGAESYVEHEVNGLLIRPGDPHAVVDGVQRLVKDGELRRRVIAGGLRTARARAYDAQVERVQATIAAAFPDLTDVRKHDWTEILERAD